MKKLIVTIIILLIILVSMIIYRSSAIGTTNNVTIEDVDNIQEYISKIYTWKEVTGEALPAFEDINQASEEWVWEVVNQNSENYDVKYDELQETKNKMFGEGLTKDFPKEGTETISYDAENDMYYILGMRTR